MKKIYFAAAFAAALLLHACNSNLNDHYASSAEEQKQESPAPKQSPQTPPPTTANANQDPVKTAIDWDRKIIRRGELKLETQDLKTYSSSIRSGIRELGGYLAQEEYSSTEYRHESKMTFKVPVHLFEEAVRLLSEKATSIVSVNIGSEDVSTEVVDTKARLEVRGKMRNRYLQLMAGAKDMDDLLKVQSEVQQLQEEIESGSSRLNYLNQASAMSTLQVAVVQVIKPEEKPQETDEAHPIKSAFLTGWSFVRDITLALLTIWPFLLAGTGIFLLLRRRARKEQPTNKQENKTN